jgi:hypothetical protein
VKGVGKMALVDAMTETFEEVTFFDNPALFSNNRIDRYTIPDGYYMYEIRHDDNCQGDAVQIGRSIIVNHWGSLIVRDEITLPGDGLLDINPEDINYGTGDCYSMDDYMMKYPSDTVDRSICPHGGDIENDCAECVYSIECYFKDGECIRRRVYE